MAFHSLPQAPPPEDPGTPEPGSPTPEARHGALKMAGHLGEGWSLHFRVRSESERNQREARSLCHLGPGPLLMVGAKVEGWHPQTAGARAAAKSYCLAETQARQ